MSRLKSTDRKRWPLLGAAMAACTLLMAAGFGLALADSWMPGQGMKLPAAPPVPLAAAAGALEEKPQLLVTALGDSLTRGTGDETGRGYVKRTVALLGRSLGKPVKLANNLAVNGLTAARLDDQLDQTGVRQAVRRADVVLLTIGGNDLFRLAQTGGSFADGGDVSPERLKKLLPQSEPLLDDIFAKLRRINPNARIVYVGLYNPFFDVPDDRSFSPYILAWNDYAHGVADRIGNATVVPTYDLFESNLRRYLSSDHFHPNGQGYERIAERVAQALQ